MGSGGADNRNGEVPDRAWSRSPLHDTGTRCPIGSARDLGLLLESLSKRAWRRNVAIPAIDVWQGRGRTTALRRDSADCLFERAPHPGDRRGSRLFAEPTAASNGRSVRGGTTGGTGLAAFHQDGVPATRHESLADGLKAIR